MPAKWQSPDVVGIHLNSLPTQIIDFEIVPFANVPVRRARIAVDVTIGAHHFGRQAEALITITPD